MAENPAPVTLVELGEDRWLEFLRRTARAFQSTRTTTEADLAPRRERFAHHRLSGIDEGGRLVATFRTWDADVAVPGASVVTDMVSSVTVEPTRRRRGHLTTMMSADLARAREAGTTMAMLLASEASIYGRFGFGVASEAVDWHVTLPAPLGHLPPGTDDVRVELVEDADLLDVAPAVHAAARAGQPGAWAMEDGSWKIMLGAVEVPGEDADRLRPALVAYEGGRAVGYARYRLPETYERNQFRSELTVDDLAATGPAALAALWRQLLAMDLVATVKAPHRPAGDLLPELLADRRRAFPVERSDCYWVRLLDVGAALAARRWSAPVDVVVEVTDRTGLSGGRWRVAVADVAAGAAVDSAAAGGPGAPDAPGLAAEVTATGAPPDVTLDVATLSAAYLGETPLARLHLTGRAVEHAPGAVRRLGAAMAWEPTTSPTLHGF